MDFEGVDLDAAMSAVLDDMGAAAKQFKARRYAPRPKPAPAPEAPAAEDESVMPTASELESMLNGG